MTDVLAELNRIFRDVVDNPDVSLSPTTTANDVEDWDSLHHVIFIVAIEKHFKIKFTRADIHAWKNVGAMRDAIAAKLAG